MLFNLINNGLPGAWYRVDADMENDAVEITLFAPNGHSEVVAVFDWVGEESADAWMAEAKSKGWYADPHKWEI